MRQTISIFIHSIAYANVGSRASTEKGKNAKLTCATLKHLRKRSTALHSFCALGLVQAEVEIMDAQPNGAPTITPI